MKIVFFFVLIRKKGMITFYLAPDSDEISYEIGPVFHMFASETSFSILNKSFIYFIFLLQISSISKASRDCN